MDKLTSALPPTFRAWWPYIATGALAISLATHSFDAALVARFVRLCGSESLPAYLPFIRHVQPSLEVFLAEHVWHATVSTNDLDLLVHMNNARYPREADFARSALFVESGVFRAANLAGTPLVTAAQTIRYRRELAYGSKYEIRTTIVGLDDNVMVLQQLFVCRGDVFAVMFVREAASRGKKRVVGPVAALRRQLGWTDEAVAEVRPGGVELPADVAMWLQSTLDSSERVVPKRQ